MDAVQHLTQICPRPPHVDPKWCSPALFDNFKLSHGPPPDLLELYRTYGAGTFQCETENLDLFDPIVEGPEELAYVVENSKAGASEDDSLFNFFASDAGLPLNMILWGHTGNGVLLASVKLEALSNWTVIEIANVDVNSLMHFKSATQVLRECFVGGLQLSNLSVWKGQTTFKELPAAHGRV